MFTFSKLFWYVVNPGNLLLLALVLGCVLLWTRYRRAGALLVGFAAVSALCVTVLPVGAWLMQPLEERFSQPAYLPENAAGIILLGGSVQPVISKWRGQPSVNEHAERLHAFVELAARYPDARLIFTGGSGNLLHPELKEAPVAKAVLQQIGFDTNRVLFEDRARNTYENAIWSHAAVDPAPDARWILITSAFHMPRAVGAFRRAGWRVIPYPVDYITTGQAVPAPGFDLTEGLKVVRWAAHEWTGLAAYWVLGRTDALFPTPK